jgi:hypothetical protein
MLADADMGRNGRRPEDRVPAIFGPLVLEAGAGIEPAMEDLQSSALPLGHPAGQCRRLPVEQWPAVQPTFASPDAGFDVALRSRRTRSPAAAPQAATPSSPARPPHGRTISGWTVVHGPVAVVIGVNRSFGAGARPSSIAARASPAGRAVRSTPADGRVCDHQRRAPLRTPRRASLMPAVRACPTRVARVTTRPHPRRDRPNPTRRGPSGRRRAPTTADAGRSPVARG